MLAGWLTGWLAGWLAASSKNAVEERGEERSEERGEARYEHNSLVRWASSWLVSQSRSTNSFSQWGTETLVELAGARFVHQC